MKRGNACIIFRYRAHRAASKVRSASFKLLNFIFFLLQPAAQEGESVPQAAALL